MRPWAQLLELSNNHVKKCRKPTQSFMCVQSQGAVVTQGLRESAEPGQLGLDPTALPSSALGGCLEPPL